MTKSSNILWLKLYETLSQTFVLYTNILYKRLVNKPSFRLLKKPKLFSRQRSSEQAMTDDSEVTTSVNKLVSKALSLLRHLTRDFPPVQKAVMLHFEDIVNVKGYYFIEA